MREGILESESDSADKRWPSAFASFIPVTLDNGLFTVSEAYACVRSTPQQRNLCGRPPG